MSIKFWIDGKFAVVSARGVSTFEEVRSTFDEIPTSDALHLPIKILFDARHTQYAPPAEELVALAEHLGQIKAYRDSRWAVVAHPNTHIFGVCRMFCCYAEYEGLCIEAFSDDKAAREWLLKPQAQFA